MASSMFETPVQQRNYPPGTFTPGGFAQTPVSPAGSTLYPDLPQELSRPYNRAPAYNAPEPQRPPPSTAPVAASAGAAVVVQAKPAVKTEADNAEVDNLPQNRAAMAVSEALAFESRYPPLDEIVSHGQSQDYDIPDSYPYHPFVKTNDYMIPDKIFEQYNRATCHTMLGLFADLKQAWVTVDNRLYIWDYQSQGGLQGYEGCQGTITAVKMAVPKPGVFVKDVTHILVLATTVDMVLLALAAVPNARGTFDVTVYETKMSVPTKGMDITTIETSASTGRIFFGGKGDNEVYEFTYQAEERWFQGRCGKVCHTNKGVSSFAPRLSIWSAPKDTEHIIQMAVDDTRSLLYTLSSKSTIRTFSLRDGGMSLTVTYTYPQILSNTRVMLGNVPSLATDTPVISISPITAQQARRTHLAATTTSGCRLFLSAVSGDSYSADAPPSNMQVIHVRFPPAGFDIQNNVRWATVIQPGYFFCFYDKTHFDGLLLAAPDSTKIKYNHLESAAPKLQLIETGMDMPIDSRVETVSLVSEPFEGAKNPQGFGNEAAVQFERPPIEVAVLTNSGVHIIRRRRQVEIFDSILRYGQTNSPLGIENEVRKFFDYYGRREGCASALAVACGASADSPAAVPSRITDVEVVNAARRFYIEFGGKPSAADRVYDTSALPSLDSIKVSGRAEGLALYVARIVRPIWKAAILRETPGLAGGVTYATNVPASKLKTIQDLLLRCATFLHENRNFIVGLSGAESLMAAGSKFDEVANQAEHRILHSLVTLIESGVEGISFVMFLLDDKLDDIMLSLPQSSRDNFKLLSYSQLFSQKKGQVLAKEVVNAIVNRNIAAGMDVDTIADALRRKCGSLCSADDVVVFRAVEQVRKARTDPDPDTKQRCLRESLRLFEETAAALDIENLKDTIGEYRGLQYYPGAVQLALTVAQEADRGNQALVYLHEGPPTTASPTAEMYHKRMECYRLVFDVLQDIDTQSGQSPDMVDGVVSSTARMRNETWQLVYNSDDELFHNALYEWLWERGLAERLLDIESPYVLGYFQRRSLDSIEHCDLLWRYYARREMYYEAAVVLHELAQSDFQLTLENRLEFLSRARGFCNSYGAMGTRQKMVQLNQAIQEELDVAAIQDEILRRVREDPRITPEKKARLEERLNANLIDLSKLFNLYADPYAYMEVCLAIFQAADFRGTNEIKKCWEQLISQVHEKAIAEGQVEPWELVADTFRRLGPRFSSSDYIFPPADLVKLLETYAFENQRDVGPPNWVIDTLLESRMAPDQVIRVLDEMVYRDEVPFRGNARRRLVRDIIYAAEVWFQTAMRKGTEAGFRRDMVEGVLSGLERSVPGLLDREDVMRLRSDMDRRLGTI